MKKIVAYILKMLAGRSGCPNSKLHFGAIFAVVLIVGLFFNVDATLYQTLTFAMLSLFGISSVDNLTVPKIETTKTETITKESKTTTDTAAIAKDITDKAKEIIKGKE